MAQAIFLRAANVGGNNVFRPKQFALDHPALELTNIGHAGTFVSRRDDAGLLDELLAALPVVVPVARVPQAQVQALIARPPAIGTGTKAEVTIHLEPPTAHIGSDWSLGDGELRLVADHGWCIVTERVPGGRLNPDKELHKVLGVPGTTRSWGVMEKVAKA